MSDCDEVLVDMRERRERLLRKINAEEACFKKDHAALIQFWALRKAEETILEVLRQHGEKL